MPSYLISPLDIKAMRFAITHFKHKVSLQSFLSTFDIFLPSRSTVYLISSWPKAGVLSRAAVAGSLLSAVVC